MARPVMHRALALATAALILLPTVHAAELAIEPPNPAPVMDEVLREAIESARTTVSQTQEEVGNTTDVRRAQAALVQAVDTFNAGDHHRTIQALLELHGWVNLAQWWHDAQSADDPEAAYVASVDSSVDLALTRFNALHERLIDLQGAGPDLFILDGAITAADLLARGEVMLTRVGDFRQTWNDGNRQEAIRQALAGLSTGPTVLADLAHALMTATLRAAPEVPVGPVLGNATLGAVADRLVPALTENTRSSFEAYGQVVRQNLESGEFIALFGALVTWARHQPLAEAQNTPEQGRTGVNATMERFTEKLDEEVLSISADLGVQGVTARLNLRSSVWTHWNTQKDMENATNESAEAREKRLLAAIGSGMGELSAARMGVAILQIAAGEEPLAPLFVFPFSSGEPVPPHGDPAGDGPVTMWVVGGVAALAVLVAGVWWMRRN